MWSKVNYLDLIKKKLPSHPITRSFESVQSVSLSDIWTAWEPVKEIGTKGCITC